MAFDAAACRAKFPALQLEFQGRSAVFLDGPAGSQTPQSVIDAIGRYLATTNANQGGVFATSRASDALLDEAHRAVADLFGARDAECVAFGANMTTLTFAFSRALSRTWRAGDEIVVTRLDHDANVSPWVMAARDADVVVRQVAIRPDDCTLDMDDLRRQLTPRTRLVAVGAASNAVGTVNPVSEIVRLAHAVGALVFVDAVHYAPHRLIDVEAWDCDFLAASAYKFFGPHVGLLWGRREFFESLPVYKVRPATNDLPGRWMSGTQNHEGIAGTLAAIEYLADLGRVENPAVADRRAALKMAFETIAGYEHELADHLLTGLAGLPEVRVWGMTQKNRSSERVPTVAITHRRLPPLEVAAQLADRGIFVWHGNFYALPLTEALGLEPEGLVRLGLLHYSTHKEIDLLLDALKRL